MIAFLFFWAESAPSRLDWRDPSGATSIVPLVSDDRDALVRDARVGDADVLVALVMAVAEAETGEGGCVTAMSCH